MADGHGGQRTPEHPAPVSGPGALSQRTDGGPTSQPPMVADDQPYGHRKAMEALQGAAPLAGAGVQTANLPALADESLRPDEPVTAGNPLGAGIGPEAAGIQTPTSQTLQQLAPLVGSFEMLANLPGATAQTRAFVRQLKARLAAQ